MPMDMVLRTGVLPTSPGGCKAPRFPPEILLHIFELLTGDFDHRLHEPSIDVGDRSPWSMSLRAKKSIVCVCKTWRVIAIPYLYQRVYLHRIGQLIALVKVLDGDTIGFGGAKYGPYVQYIHGRFLVPGNWEDVYFRHFVRLLTLCTSARTFSMVIAWTNARIYPTRQRYTLFNSMRLAQSSAPSFFKSLKTLTFTPLNMDLLEELPSKQEASPNDETTTITFDNLDCLTCDLTEAMGPELVRGLAVVSQSFILPKLRRLKIYNPHIWNDDRMNTLSETVFKVLATHGANLTSLEIDLPSFSGVLSKGIADIFSHTPLLQELRCSCHVFLLIDPSSLTSTSFPSLKKFDILASTKCFGATDFLQQDRDSLVLYLSMASNRKIFPALCVVRILREGNSSTLLDDIVSSSDHSEVFEFLLSWTKKFRELDVAFLGADDEPIAPSSPGRWSGRFITHDNAWMNGEEEVHTDPEDLSLDSDELSYRDESSEYSSWESEPEDGETDPREYGSDVDSIEAFDIFSSTVDDEYSYDD